MIQIQPFTFNPFYENTYLVYDKTKECIIVDPGCYEKTEQEELLHFIHTHQLNVVCLINTHCHIDHVLGNQFIKDTFQVPLKAHTLEAAVLKSVTSYAPSYGFAKYTESHIDTYIDEGDTIHFGDSTVEIIWVPGHTPGHVALYNKTQDICLAGDVLFSESIGRTDLPGGDFDTLIQSIHTKLFQLPESTEIYAGHGENTTIGYEKKNNPFCGLR